MPGYKFRPESIVNQIRNNLLDRYESGYPILKELLQNADDAGARRFRLDARAGWPKNAENPLLQGPGLLIVNDGEFRQKDQEGILSFGESVKAADDATIGKFGFGQKAVFHLCDAFAVHAFGQTEPFSDVVNPFEDVEVTGNVAGEWKALTESDAGLLRDAAADFRDRGLILWLPLRRDGLHPAPDAGFSSNRPTIDETVRQMDKPDDLRSLLTMLRHLRDVEIRENGETRRTVRVLDGDRLLGPQDWREGVRTFAGSIETGPSASKEKFVAREAMLWNERRTCTMRSRAVAVSAARPSRSAATAMPRPARAMPHHSSLRRKALLHAPGAVFRPHCVVYRSHGIDMSSSHTVPARLAARFDHDCRPLLLRDSFTVRAGRFDTVRHIQSGAFAVTTPPGGDLPRMRLVGAVPRGEYHWFGSA